MRTYKKFLPFLYLFLATLVPLFLFIAVIDPNQKFEIFGTAVHFVVFLLAIIFVAAFFLFTFIFANTRRGFLGGVFILGFFLLRFFGLKNIFHALLLLTVLLLIEFLYRKR